MSPAATRGVTGPSPVRAVPGGISSLASGEQSLRQLELTITRKIEGLVQGDHEGRYSGVGTEPGESYLYQPGDDVRRIDWNLTARSGEVHTRRTLADRELEVWVVVDGSASLDYGTAYHEKRDLAASVVGAFGFLTVRAGNRLGAVVYDGHEDRISPPRVGREAVLGLVRSLQRRPRTAADDPKLLKAQKRSKPSATAADTATPRSPNHPAVSSAASNGDHAPGSLAAALRRTRLLAQRRGVVVVVSDLLDPSDWPTELRKLTARHDVIVAHLTDPREDVIPAVGVLALVDPETGQRQEVQTSSRKFRERYAAAAAERRQTIHHKVKASRAAYLPVATDRDWLRDVVNHVVARKRRR